MPGNRHSFAERLDRDRLQASLTAEKRVKKFQIPAWLVALAQASALCVIALQKTETTSWDAIILREQHGDGIAFREFQIMAIRQEPTHICPRYSTTVLKGGFHVKANPNQYQSDFHTIICWQDKVGWKHILFWRFVCDWHYVQGCYLDCLSPTVNLGTTQQAT